MKPLIPKVEPKPSPLKKEFLGGAVKYLLNCKPSGLAIALLALTGLQSRAQTYTPYSFTTFAGVNGLAGYGNGGGAQFNQPLGDAVDSAGNIYVADTDNHIIRKIDSAGNVTTVAGHLGFSGSADGKRGAAYFYSPAAVAVDSAGNLYVADEGNYTIRKIDTTGNVTTLAGKVGSSGSADGQGGAAGFFLPQGVAVDKAGNVYVADTDNSTIRKIDSGGNVTTLAGTAGVLGSANGQGSAAQLYYPYSVALDGAGNLYVADAYNQEIRKIDTAANVTTLAGQAGVTGGNDGQGSSAQFYYPQGVTADAAGNVYVADTGNQTIREIDTAGNVTTLAGFPELAGSSDGNGINAEFNHPKGVAVDSAGNVYVADDMNDTIRKIDTAANVTTLAGIAGETGPGVRFNEPYGVAVDTLGNVYVEEEGNNTIRKIDTAGNATTLAGQAGVQGSADGNGNAAQFYRPYGLAVDSAGNVYVADTYNDTIRKIDTAANVTTLAGKVGVTGTANGNGSAARFYSPCGVAPDNAGNVYVADEGNNTIRKIDTAGNVTLVAGTPGVSGSADGNGSAALFFLPQSLAVDSAGNIYVADTLNSTIRKIDTAGNVTTLAGAVGVLGSVDGQGTAANFKYPQGVTLDSAGNIFVVDAYNFTIRKIDTALNVTTLAGTPGIIGSADGVGAAAQFYYPRGLAVDQAGNIYVADTDNERISKGLAVNLFLVTATRSGASLILSWPGAGTLQSSANVAGPYVDVAGSSNPYTVTPSGLQQFYRARR